MASAPSTIGMAYAVDIPKLANNGRDTFTGVAANKLPTPPSSVSPNLPHAGDKHGHVDSDLDLQDKPRQLNAEALDSLGDLDSVGVISPGLLAKHHLPDILLAHGPLAIRHIMGYLTTSVPGFSRITSAKARRLVVAALEGRGNTSEAGASHGQVEFEKVGWGRWDAKMRGQPSRNRQIVNLSPPNSVPSSYALSARLAQTPASDRFAPTYTGKSAVFSQSEAEYGEREDTSMEENEADKMSLDERDDGYVSSEPEILMDEDLGEGDATDEEDWQSIGAEALRARSLPVGARTLPRKGHLYQPIADYAIPAKRPRLASYQPATDSLLPPIQTPTFHSHNLNFAPTTSVNDQDREAVEALLRLGSM